jgi:hypothetical protein
MTRLLPILASLLLLACCFTACTRTPDVTIVNAEIRTEFRQRDGAAGQWDHDRRTIYLSAMLAKWTFAHECAHAADSLGLPYAQVVAMTGTLPPHLAYQQDLARRVARDAAKIGGPHAHWIALGRICGPQAVGHAEILNHVRRHL